MKKTIAAMAMGALALGAQAKGRIETYDYEGFRLHIYYTNDVMADASYIIEGADALVTMEEPLFKENVAEFAEYVAKLGKPVCKRITDYHIGDKADKTSVMPEGMPAFAVGPIYGGMMKSFAQAFGDAIVEMPVIEAAEVAFGSTQEYAGVSFTFNHGAASDFPGASIVIGGKVYYTHWTPAKAHISHLQIGSLAAVDAEIAEAEKSLASGAELFIGGHGGATNAENVKFKIEYLKTIKRLVAENKTPEAFSEALKAAYPLLPGADGLKLLAGALYK